ncbi:MAG: hypothetical protein KAY59_11535 [Acidobacteria bacterium]|nr:hypothetical protein [Acidobacteriota bacterium]
MFTILSIVWFKNRPAIRFEPVPADGMLTSTELIANILVASIVAVAATLAVMSIGRGMGWWKE